MNNNCLATPKLSKLLMHLLCWEEGEEEKEALLRLRQGNDGIRRHYTDVYKECLVHSQKNKQTTPVTINK